MFLNHRLKTEAHHGQWWCWRPNNFLLERGDKQFAGFDKLHRVQGRGAEPSCGVQQDSYLQAHPGANRGQSRRHPQLRQARRIGYHLNCLETLWSNWRLNWRALNRGAHVRKISLSIRLYLQCFHLLSPSEMHRHRSARDNRFPLFSYLYPGAISAGVRWGSSIGYLLPPMTQQESTAAFRPTALGLRGAWGLLANGGAGRGYQQQRTLGAALFCRGDLPRVELTCIGVLPCLRLGSPLRPLTAPGERRH